MKISSPKWAPGLPEIQGDGEFLCFDGRLGRQMSGEQILGFLFKHDRLLNMLTPDDAALRKLWESAVAPRPASANDTSQRRDRGWLLGRGDRELGRGGRERAEYEKPWRHSALPGAGPPSKSAAALWAPAAQPPPVVSPASGSRASQALLSTRLAQPKGTSLGSGRSLASPGRDPPAYSWRTNDTAKRQAVRQEGLANLAAKLQELGPVGENPFYRKLCLLTARLRAFQDAFGDRKPRFCAEREAPAKSASPARKGRAKRLFATTNIRIRENKSPSVEKTPPPTNEHHGVLDLAVQGMLKAPASEQRLTPLREALQSGDIGVKMRHADSIDYSPAAAGPGQGKVVNRYDSNMHATFSRPKLGGCSPKRERVQSAQITGKHGTYAQPRAVDINRGAVLRTIRMLHNLSER